MGPYGRDWPAHTPSVLVFQAHIPVLGVAMSLTSTSGV